MSNMATTSFTSVGNSAGSPELILRPSLVTVHDAERLSAEEAYLGYDAVELFSMIVGEVMWERFTHHQQWDSY